MKEYNSNKSMEKENSIYDAAFDVIYRKGCIERADWIGTLIDYYSDEVTEAFGCDPFDVEDRLADLWETMDYTDPRMGVCLLYSEWAEYFSNEFSHIIYDELIEAKESLSLSCSPGPPSRG